ncbi:MAG: periplasmic protease [Elusimicrobia bacterium]|nr:MAG: periplasmic protease [Elusimicrobiota bacterium]KAF0155876.1 MAG: periplasmic protease [Elusimicrobiota bacterium]
MKTIMNALAGIIFLSVLAVTASAENKVIYGEDDRLDYFEAPASRKALADSVVSLWNSYKVTRDGANYKLSTMKFADANNLCAGERFREQQKGAFCSGSLVGEDLVMTAGHCIRNPPVNSANGETCASTRLVFGFAIKSRGGSSPSTVPEADVYSCKEIVTHGLDNGGADFAIIRLDRKVAGRKPLPVHRGASLKKGAGMFVIGHPSGLPLKVAEGASVRDASNSTHYVADLDTYGGNSGSPVFDSRTSLIAGILVRGDTDFVTTAEGCRRSNVIGQNEGRGEDVTKVSQLSASVPKTALTGETEPAEAPSREVRLESVDAIRESFGDSFSIEVPEIAVPE